MSNLLPFLEMDKQEESRTWLKFFKDAGIPKKTGASYAHIFVENRIHDDMLPELTVDYLRLMGITLMGDIIAILRHCKSVHQDSVRKVVILQSKDEVKESSSSGSSSDESSDVEMIEVTKTATKRIPTSLKTIESIKKEPRPNTEVKQVKSQIFSKITSSKPTAISVSEKKTPAEPVKRKYDEEIKNSSQEEPSSKSTVSSNSGRSILKSTAPAVKKLRVTSENETMGPKLPPPKKTVFERLGAEAEPPQVSSTTEVPMVETKFTRIISSMPLTSVNLTSDDDVIGHKASSVFNRLGGLKDSSQATKTTGPSLPYAGVLKSPLIKKKLITAPVKGPIKIVRGTMRADEPEIPVKLRATRNLTQNKYTIRVGEGSLTNRLKLQLSKESMFKRKAVNVDSEGIFARDFQPSNVSVKKRLGLVSSSGEETYTSNIKQRISRPIVKKHSYDDDDDGDHFMSRSHMDNLAPKKVSFGKVERRLIAPASSLRSSVFSKSSGRGIHSRLGTMRYS